MIVQPTTEASPARGVPGVPRVAAVITKLTPAVTVPMVNSPSAVEAPIPCLVNKMIELAVTAVVVTVIVPVISVVVPVELATAVAVFDTAGITSLFPDVPRTRLPFVAVIAPRVAVNVVEAVRDPVTAVLPVALPMFTAPVPPVPIVVTPAPVMLI